MKKTRIALILTLAALSASAAWWPFGSNKETDDVVMPPPSEPMRERIRERMEPREHGPKLSPEQMEKIKAQREAIDRLGEAARNESDPVKKEELIGQLRAELNKAADKMQQMHEKRLQQAEKELGRLRTRMEEAQKNRDPMIEKQIQRILAGEKPEPPEGAFGKHRPKRDLEAPVQ